MGRLLKHAVITCLIASAFLGSVKVIADEDLDDVFDLDEEDSSVDDDYDDVDEANKAYLLVRKTVPDPRVVLGSNLTVTVQVYNAGKSSAKSVVVKDTVNKEFSVVEGKTSLAFDSLAPGASGEFVYTLVVKTAGLFHLPPVQVKYVSADDDSKLETSTLPKPLLVMTPTENIIALALKAGAYATFGSIQSAQQWLQVAYGAAGIGVVVLLFFGYSALRDANKRWKYQRALKEVEKMQ